MANILAGLRDQPAQHFPAGTVVLDQGSSTGLLYILIDGEVEVTKDGVTLARTAEPGAIFGDLSALLLTPHTASVRTLRDSNFHVLPDPKGFLERNPAVAMHLCELLARRLEALTRYLMDVKQQFSGHDHLGLVDGMLDTLIHRQPKARIAPRASTARDPEIPD